MPDSGASKRVERNQIKRLSLFAGHAKPLDLTSLPVDLGRDDDVTPASSIAYCHQQILGDHKQFLVVTSDARGPGDDTARHRQMVGEGTAEPVAARHFQV